MIINKKILVTGGAGFIGSHLVDQLIQEDCKVAVVDDLSTGKKENLNPKAKFYKIDIQDSKISEVFQKEKPEIVFHLAARIDVLKSVEDPIADAKINILGSLNVLENAAKSNAKKIIFSSSCAIYGEEKILPTPEICPPRYLSPYGINKLTIEKYLIYYKSKYNLNYTVLRLANVYGPRQNDNGEGGVVAVFIDKIVNNENPIINGDGKQTRDFVYVKDAARAFFLAGKSGFFGEINIGTEKETSINELCDQIKKITKSKINPLYGPSKTVDQKRSCLDCKKAKKELGWKPDYDLDQGIRDTIKWFKSKDNKNRAIQQF